MKTVRDKIRQINHDTSAPEYIPPSKKKRVPIAVVIVLMLVACVVVLIVQAIMNHQSDSDVVLVDKKTKEVSTVQLGGKKEIETKYMWYVHKVSDRKHLNSKDEFFVTKDMFNKYELGSQVHITYKFKKITEIEQK